MTGLQIYNLAKAKLYEDTGINIPEERYSVHFLNQTLAETFSVENNIRESNGEELLNSIPWITKIEDEIPYHEELTRTAFVYAVAEHYWQEELDTYQAEVCHGRYLQAVNDCKRGIWVTL